MEYPYINLKCPLHKNEKVIAICCDIDCTTPYICQKCINDNKNTVHQPHHLQQKKPNESIHFLAKEIKHSTEEIQNIFKETIDTPQNQNLLKWVEDYDHHFQKIEDYIKTQKFTMEQDMQQAMQAFAEIIQEQMQKIQKKLDNFLNNYKQSFDIFRSYINEILVLNNNFKYFCNPNNLSAKLKCEIPQNNVLFINQIKKSLAFSKKIQANQKQFVENIRQAVAELNIYIDKLPIYSTSQLNELLLTQMEEVLSNYLEKSLEVIQTKPLIINKTFIESVSGVQVNQGLNDQVDLQQSQQSVQGNFKRKKTQIFEDTSNINIQQQLLQYQKNLELLSISSQQLQLNEDFNTKNLSSCDANNKILEVGSYQHEHLKFKFQRKIFLQTQINCMCYLQDKILSLGCQDGTIIIYNMQNNQSLQHLDKLQFHQDEIISLNNFENLYLQSLNQKDIKLFCSCSLDSTLIVWRLENCNKLLINKKLTGFNQTVHRVLDLEDGQRLVAGDLQGEISIWDYQQGKQITIFKGKHNSKITDMILLKKMDQFIVGSQDNIISIYKLSYSGSNMTTCECFSVLQSQFGGIVNIMALPHEWPIGNLLLIGNSDGSLKLFDPEKNYLINDIQGHKGSVSEMLIIKDLPLSHNNQFSLITIGSNDKIIKGWNFSTGGEDQKKIFINKQELYEMEGYVNSLEGKQIIQLVSSEEKEDPQLLILNDTNKEIVVLDILFYK